MFCYVAVLITAGDLVTRIGLIHSETKHLSLPHDMEHRLCRATGDSNTIRWIAHDSGLNYLIVVPGRTDRHLLLEPLHCDGNCSFLPSTLYQYKIFVCITQYTLHKYYCSLEFFLGALLSAPRLSKQPHRRGRGGAFPGEKMVSAIDDSLQQLGAAAGGGGAHADEQRRGAPQPLHLLQGDT